MGKSTDKKEGKIAKKKKATTVAKGVDKGWAGYLKSKSKYVRISFHLIPDDTCSHS